MKQSSNKKSREATAFLYERLSRDDNLEGDARVCADLVIRFTSHQLFQQPIGFIPASIDRSSGHAHALCYLFVCHP